MKGKLRYVAIVAGLLLLLLIALPFLINANTFRPAIEQPLSSTLGRKVQLGDIGLSILSTSLSASDLSISDDPSFGKSSFLSAKSLEIGVELWPLITSRTLNITSLSIEKPEVLLLRNRQGRWNLSSLAAGPAPSASVSKPVGSAPTTFTVSKLKIKKGRVTIGSTTSDKRSVYDNVDLEASGVSLTSQFPVILTATLPGGGVFKTDGRVGPLNQADALLSPLDAKVTIDRLDLARTGFVDPATGIAGIVDVTNTLQSKNGLAHSQGSLKINSLQLAKGGTPSSVPVNVDFNISYDLRKDAGIIHQGVVKIGGAVCRLSGTFDRRDEATILNANLDGQNLPVRDLQTALSALGIILPKGSKLETGTVNANLTVQGPTDKLVTAGNVGLFNARLAGFDMGSKMAALSAFAGIPKGSGDTSIEKLTTSLRMAPEGIQTTNLELVMPAIGQLNGGGMISSSNALNLKMVATLSGQSGLASTLGGLTGRSTSRSVRIPFLVQGTTSDPKFVPDVGGTVGSALESGLGKALGNNPQTKGLSDALGGLLGGKKKSK